MLSRIWGNLIIHMLTTEMSTTLWKIVWQFLKKKLNMSSPYGSGMALLGIYP